MWFISCSCRSNRNCQKDNVRVQISHVKSVGPKFWGRGIELIEGIERARKEGLDVAGDQYPYHWSSTPISGCMFPRWSLEGGRDKTLERLKDADIRENIKSETSNFINRFHGAGGCVLADYAAQSSLEGLNLYVLNSEGVVEGLCSAKNKGWKQSKLK